MPAVVKIDEKSEGSVGPPDPSLDEESPVALKKNVEEASKDVVAQDSSSCKVVVQSAFLTEVEDECGEYEEGEEEEYSLEEEEIEEEYSLEEEIIPEGNQTSRIIISLNPEKSGDSKVEVMTTPPVSKVSEVAFEVNSDPSGEEAMECSEMSIQIGSPEEDEVVSYVSHHFVESNEDKSEEEAHTTDSSEGIKYLPSFVAHQVTSVMESKEEMEDSPVAESDRSEVASEESKFHIPTSFVAHQVSSFPTVLEDFSSLDLVEEKRESHEDYAASNIAQDGEKFDGAEADVVVEENESEDISMKATDSGSKVASDDNETESCCEVIDKVKEYSVSNDEKTEVIGDICESETNSNVESHGSDKIVLDQLDNEDIKAVSPVVEKEIKESDDDVIVSQVEQSYTGTETKTSALGSEPKDVESEDDVQATLLDSEEKTTGVESDSQIQPSDDTELETQLSASSDLELNSQAKTPDMEPQPEVSDKDPELQVCTSDLEHGSPFKASADSGEAKVTGPESAPHVEEGDFGTQVEDIKSESQINVSDVGHGSQIKTSHIESEHQIKENDFDAETKSSSSESQINASDVEPEVEIKATRIESESQIHVLDVEPEVEIKATRIESESQIHVPDVEPEVEIKATRRIQSEPQVNVPDVEPELETKASNLELESHAKSSYPNIESGVDASHRESEAHQEDLITAEDLKSGEVNKNIVQADYQVLKSEKVVNLGKEATTFRSEMTIDVNPMKEDYEVEVSNSPTKYFNHSEPDVYETESSAHDKYGEDNIQIVNKVAEKNKSSELNINKFNNVIESSTSAFDGKVNESESMDLYKSEPFSSVKPSSMKIEDAKEQTSFLKDEGTAEPCVEGTVKVVDSKPDDGLKRVIDTYVKVDPELVDSLLSPDLEATISSVDDDASDASCVSHVSGQGETNNTINCTNHITQDCPYTREDCTYMGIAFLLLLIGFLIQFY